MEELEESLFDYFCSVVTELLFGDTVQHSNRNVVRLALKEIGVKEEIRLFLSKDKGEKMLGEVVGIVSPSSRTLDPFMRLIVRVLWNNRGLAGACSVPDPTTQWKEFTEWYYAMDDEQILYWEEVIANENLRG